MTKIRTRYAPSPTGRMHVGNLRTALYAYLIAKHEGGDFILRIEDTDQERYVEGAVEIIYNTLEKTGLVHDEGPDKDKGAGPYVQSERQAKGIYLEYARHKHCLHLSKEEEEEKLASGIHYVIRQNNPTEGTTTFQDEIYGDITVDNAELDDMILIKSDGYPTYNFANVVDDHLMGITHVVRGNEYLSSSPKYNRLYEAFGWDVPVYVHCPLITDEEHHKLSKRCGHSSYEDLIEQGFLSEAVVNFVALLGWSPEGNEEIFTLEELTKIFDYHHISKSPAVFDYTKLKWMNGEYMKAMDFDTFYSMAEPYLEEAIGKELDLKKIAEMVKTRIEVFPDITDMVEFFRKLPDYDTSMYTHKKMKTTPQKTFDNDSLYQMLLFYVEKKGCKNGYAMWPVRTAVSGKQMTPAGATEIMEILGKEESIARIRKGIDLLKEAARQGE